MNLSQMRDQTSKFCGDPSVTRYTATDYLNALNLAQNQFAMDTRALWKDTTWTSTADDATYALPSDFMWEESASWDGLPLLPISRRDLAILAPNTDWTIATGTPTHYLIDAEEAQKQLRLYPIPNQSSETISLRYFPFPVALAADGDIPLNASLLMVQFNLGLCAYAAWLLLAAEESNAFVSNKRKELLAIYADSAEKATELFKNTVSAGWRMRGNGY